MKDKVIIIMATFNGAAFMKEQLESIISQTYQHWELYVRDDESNDDTLSILKRYALVDQRIKIVKLEGPHGSPALNFGVLFNYVKAMQLDYLMFADQDDVWYSHKIEVSLQLMHSLEQKEGPNMPLLVYSKFQFINDTGEPIQQTLRMPSVLTMPVLLCGNYAYGCTMLLNAALVNGVKMPIDAIYHDYWIALVACIYGKAILLPQKLLGYRQHQLNASTNLQSRSATARIKRYWHKPQSRLSLLQKQYQMFRLFAITYQHQPVAKGISLLRNYLQAFKLSNTSLLYFMLSKKCRKLGLLQTFAHYYLLIRLRKKISKADTP